MMDFRTTFAVAAVGLGVLGSTAQAQDEGALRSRLRACAGIEDVAARAACYDAIPTEDTAAPAAPRPTGLGSEQVPQARARERTQPTREASLLEATVAESSQREPGIHLLTLQDGAQWQFVEGVPLSYDPPRRGSTVEIRSASMGSYLMRYRGQPAVRVRRVR